jgi:hypothetical protein
MSSEHRSDWGRLNDGQAWGPLAVDVDRALSRARLGEYEQPLMQIVRERSWGTSTRRKPPGKNHPWPDAVPVPWRPSELARETGLPRNRLSEAKADLVESRMLIETPTGLLVNKNADQWAFPTGHSRAGEARLDTAALVYAAAAWPRREAPPGGPEVSAPADNGCPPQRTTPSAPADKSVRPSGQPCPPQRTTPLYDRAQKDPTGLDKKPEDRGRAGEPPNGEDGHPRMPEPFAELCRKADRIKALADVAFAAKLRGAWEQDGDLPAWWEMIGDSAAWHEALADLAGKPRDKRHPRFYLGIVKSRHAQGGGRATTKPAPHPPVHRAPEGYTKT